MKMKFKHFQHSYYFPLYDTSTLEGIKSLEMRDGDIYFPAFPRTGHHWIFEVVSMLLRGRAETITEWKGRYSVELQTSEALSCLPSPRFLNAHMKLSDGPVDLKNKNVKIIYNLRDPKDVVVSLYHLNSAVKVYEYTGKFEDYLYLFLDGTVECGGIFNHYRDAEKFFIENPAIPVHIQVYEETNKDPLSEVQRLSDFLGLQRNDDLCKQITDKCSFSGMKTDKEDYTFKVDGENCIYRKGQVGDWRNYFTEEMLEDYYRVYEEKMAGSRFCHRYARQDT